MISDNQIDAIGAYLQTLNDLPNQGPVTLLVQEGGPEQYDPLLDGMQFLVTDRVRLQRGSMKGLSGRTIHVGQVNGINYSFDPRVLGIARVWQGGFLNMEGELSGRGDRKSTRLNSSHVAISYAAFCLKKKTPNGALVLMLGSRPAGLSTAGAQASTVTPGSGSGANRGRQPHHPAGARGHRLARRAAGA